MAKKNTKREEQWKEAKQRCRLSIEQLRRAKEMGLNPLSLIKNIPAPTQQWKQPVGDWIDGMYEKRQADAARKKVKKGVVPNIGAPWPEPASMANKGGAAPHPPAPPPQARPKRRKAPSRDPFQYRIQLAADMPFGSEDADAHLVKYVVTLLGNENGEEDEPSYVRVGDLRVWLFLVGAHQEKGVGRLFDLFDADSDEAMQLYNAVFDSDTEEPQPSLSDAGLINDLPVGTDIMHFQWGDLPTAYRRSDVALAMVERTIDLLGSGCFAATLWPWDAPAPDPATDSAAEVLAFFESQQGNEDHWGKIGFQRIPGTAILVRDLNAYGWEVESLLRGDYQRMSYDDQAEDGVTF